MLSLPKQNISCPIKIILFFRSNLIPGLTSFFFSTGVTILVSAVELSAFTAVGTLASAVLAAVELSAVVLTVSVRGDDTTGLTEGVLTTGLTAGVLTTCLTAGVLTTGLIEGELTSGLIEGVFTIGFTEGVLMTGLTKGVLTRGLTAGVLFITIFEGMQISASRTSNGLARFCLRKKSIKKKIISDENFRYWADDPPSRNGIKTDFVLVKKSKLLTSPLHAPPPLRKI